MRRLAVPLMLGFGVALALLIGRRMTTDALAVVVGVAAGVAASVPASLLLMALLRRERGVTRDPAPPQDHMPPVQPNVLMIDPMMIARQYGYDVQRRPEPPPALLADGGQRRLRVVGEEDDDG